ncbi:MAG TPA: hypothetical protein VGG39_05910 [Polyangiaceae bacterium]|jgi:hypothetical protein
MSGMRARDLLPWRTFVVETSWSPTVAEIELRKKVAPQRAVPGDGGHDDAVFVGSEGHGRFRLSRRAGDQSTFPLRFDVVVESSHHQGARVVVRPRTVVLLILSLCLGAVTVIASIMAVVGLECGLPSAMLVLALPVVLAGLLSFATAREARESERLLRGIFARAPALPAPPETDEAYR